MERSEGTITAGNTHSTARTSILRSASDMAVVAWALSDAIRASTRTCIWDVDSATGTSMIEFGLELASPNDSSSVQGAGMDSEDIDSLL